MNQEIERKFLVSSEAWRSGAEGVRYRQGYLCTDPQRTVRVRTAGARGFLTIKGLSRGAARAEFEYEIPLAEANHLLDALCLRPLIEKMRYTLEAGGLTWEIDEFEGENAGLILAEVELEREDQTVDLPAWIGQEVTGDPRYYNANLIQRPYKTWA